MTNSKELKFKELLLRRDYNKLKKEYIRCYIGAKKYYESSTSRNIYTSIQTNIPLCCHNGYFFYDSFNACTILLILSI